MRRELKKEEEKEEKEEKDVDDLTFEEDDDPVCPNCGQPTEGELVCPFCGAILTQEDDALDGFQEDEEL